MDIRASLGKPGPMGLAVAGGSLVVKATKASAPDLALVAPYKGLEAGDDIDAGDNACCL